jgi:iron complex outermembrane receptor protein
MEPRDEQSLGLFAKKDLRAGDPPLGLILGLRVNIYSQFDPAVNPEVQVKFDPKPFELALSAAMSNNTPTLRQRYYESSTLSPNPDLEMERSLNLSLRAAYQPRDWFRVEASVFYDRIDDRITYVRGEGASGQYQNIGRAYLRGVDGSVGLKPLKWLEVHGAYTYLEGKDETNDLWLTCKPRHKVKADLRIRPLKRLMVALYFTYQSMTYSRSDNTETAPAFFRFDLRAEYRLDRWRLFMKIVNLLDRDYLYCDGYPAPPLTFIAGIGYKF